MRKWLCLLLSGVLLFGLTACNTAPDASGNPADVSTTTTTTTQGNEASVLATGRYNGRDITVQSHLTTTYKPYELYYFDHNIATVSTSDGFVMVDVDGKQIGEDGYYMLYNFGEDGRAKAKVDSDSEWVWIDTTGAVVGRAEAPVAKAATAMYDSSETNGIKTDEGDYLFGVKDVASGALLTQPIFEWISSLIDPLNFAVLAEGEHRKVMIDPQGKVIVTLPDESKSAYAWENYIKCEYADGTYRLLDKQGVLLNQTAFSSVSGFSDGLAVVTTGNKMGLIAADGTVVVEPQIEIDEPYTKGSPLIWKEHIVCLRQKQLTFYKITKE